MNTRIKLKIIEEFTITDRGIVVILDGETNLDVGVPHKVEIIKTDGEVILAEAYKEWMLFRKPKPIEKEAFNIQNLTTEEVPIGSYVVFN